MLRFVVFSESNSLIDKLRMHLNNEHYELTLGHFDNYGQLAQDITSSIVFFDAGMKWANCKMLLRQLYQKKCIVIFLTSENNMEEHLTAMYAGESYVTKIPIRNAELQQIISHLMCHSAYSGLQLIKEDKTAILNGNRIELTAQEFALLNALMVEGCPPISREQLLRTAWGYQSIGETRTVDVHIQRLRKKLGVDSIETVYRCGYRLNIG